MNADLSYVFEVLFNVPPVTFSVRSADPGPAVTSPSQSAASAALSAGAGSCRIWRMITGVMVRRAESDRGRQIRGQVQVVDSDSAWPTVTRTSERFTSLSNSGLPVKVEAKHCQADRRCHSLSAATVTVALGPGRHWHRLSGSAAGSFSY